MKRLARKEVSEARRDLVQTGNVPLRSRTVETLRDTNALQQLRHRMGVSATGFQSKHCECLCKQFLIFSLNRYGRTTQY